MVRPWNWWRYVRDAADYEAEKADYRWRAAGRPADPRDALSLPRGADGQLLDPPGHRPDEDGAGGGVEPG